jgi:hypothetical protein
VGWVGGASTSESEESSASLDPLPAESDESPTTASTPPTSTVSSSSALISSSVPATGDGISVSTLSVETSSSGSSTSTESPTCFSQRVTVPSVTLSPSCGRATSVPPPLEGFASPCGAGASVAGCSVGWLSWVDSPVGAGSVEDS